jgi:hypothetical protein
MQTKVCISIDFSDFPMKDNWEGADKVGNETRYPS